MGSELLHTPLLPGPAAVLHAARAVASDGTLPRALLLTSLRLVAGYAIALALGVPIGVMLARSRLAKEAAGPLLLGVSAVPSICWLPLAILWFGLSETAIQVVVVLGATLPIAVATESSVRHVPVDVERAARTMGASGVCLMVTVTLPAALPGIVAGAKLGWTFALRSLMAGELLFVSGGLGQLLETGRDLGDTALVLAVVVVIIGLGRASEAALFSRIDRAIGRRWGVGAV